MPTYILKTAASDLSGGADFNKVLSTGTEAASSITLGVGAAATEDNYGFTASGVPNNAAWETGNWTVEVNVTTANMKLEASMAISRVDSAGAQQEISAFSAEQNAGAIGVLTFSFTSLAWTAGATGDRIRIVYRFRNTATMGGDQTAVIETGTVSCEVVSPVTEAGGATVTLAGVSGGVAAVSGGIVRTLALAGAPAGVAAVSGNVVGTFVLQGAIAGAATVSAPISVERTLAGISAGIASVSGPVAVERTLAGMSAGVATVSGEVIEELVLAGLAAGEATVSGAVVRTRAILGVSAGAASVSSNIILERALQGTTAGTASVSGELTATAVSGRWKSAMSMLWAG